MAPREPQPRWTVLLRIVLAIPALVFATALGYVAGLVSFLVWIVALCTGRAPRGMRDLLAYSLRFRAQTFGYLLLLTSKYPTLASD